MSANEVWARLGGDPAGIGKGEQKGERDTLHAVGGEKPSACNNPTGTPFGDSLWPRTVPDALRSTVQLFEMGDAVLHAKTGGVYGILDVPSSGLTIERTGELAYCYKRMDGTDPRKWVRAQSEMEDGRFAVHRRAPSRR